VVDDFNLSQSNLNLVLEPGDPESLIDTLASQIASGNAPDIVGPIEISSAAVFEGQWLDLAPLIDATGYDLSQYPEALVDFYNVDGQGQIGLPFAVFPSMVYYNRDLFDQAGLDYPPQSYGDAYLLPDGSQVDWNYDTLRDVALLLTVDANGNTAADPGFDPANIVQYGFAFQNQDPRAVASSFGAGALLSPGGQTAAIPAQWADAWHWTYDGVWTDYFIPNQAALDSAAFGSGNPFNSGSVAMTLANLGDTCCLANVGNWDLAAVPSYNGQTTANLEADTFYILKTSQNPEAAFQVLTYLLGEAAPPLLDLNGGLPARTADQAAYIAGLDAQFPHGVNWQVAVDSLAFVDSPSYQGYLPNYTLANDRLGLFAGELFSTPGLDMAAEIAALEADLQALFDQD
jgi:multiple sugar transport system substrate-binding protein